VETATEIHSQTIKPEIISGKPDFKLFFKTADLKNISKVKSILCTGLNIGITQELVINRSSGGIGSGAKPTINDAGLNLTFKLMNLDKMMVQSATDELWASLGTFKYTDN